MSSYQEIILTSLGEFGLSQLLIVLACKAPGFFAAWSMIMMSFAGAQPKWWSVSEIYNSTSNTTTFVQFLKICPTENQTVIFDDSIYTIVSEWSLICDKKWIPRVITTVQMSGVLVGAAVVGQLGDWIGRKKCMLIVYTSNLIFIFVESFSVNWYMMAICVFFVGFSLGGYLVVQSVFMLEFVSTKWRTSIGLIPAWGLGVMCFGGLFKLLPNWRHLCIANATLGFPFLIAIWFTPESIRWLFTKGRVEEAKIIIKRLAKRNGRVCPDLQGLDKALEKDFEEQTRSSTTHTYFSLFKYRLTRVKAPIFAYLWFYCTFAYYGLTLGVSKLAGDVSVNMVLMGVGETLCLVMVWLLSKRFGRRNTTIILMACMAITSFGITIAYASNSNIYESAKSGLALSSRFFLSAAWSSIILFTVETFPTEIRAIAYGFASVSGRIGGIIAPQNEGLADVVDHLPFTVNGTLAVISCLLCLFLQDTYHQDLSDRLETNAEILDREHNSTTSNNVKLSEVNNA